MRRPRWPPRWHDSSLEPAVTGPLSYVFDPAKSRANRDMRSTMIRSTLVAVPVLAVSLLSAGTGSAQPLNCVNGQFWDPITNTCQTPRLADDCAPGQYWNALSNVCRPLGSCNRSLAAAARVEPPARVGRAFLARLANFDSAILPLATISVRRVVGWWSRWSGRPSSQESTCGHRDVIFAGRARGHRRQRNVLRRDLHGRGRARACRTAAELHGRRPGGGVGDSRVGHGDYLFSHPDVNDFFTSLRGSRTRRSTNVFRRIWMPTRRCRRTSTASASR